MNNKRYEIKFVIPYEQVGDVIQWLYSETKLTTSYPDRYVNSLYFDDIYYNTIHFKINDSSSSLLAHTRV